MAVPTTANDPAAAYNPPVTKPEGPRRLHRAALLLTHLLHLACCLAVMSIAAYLIAKQNSQMSEKFCIVLAVLSALVFLIALIHALFGFHRSVLPAFMLLLSCLWLAASVVAAVEYKDTCTAIDGDMLYVSDSNYCALRRALIAWSFLAFLTCLLGTLLEALLWRHRRHVDKPFVANGPDPPRAMSTAPPAAPAAPVPETAV